MDDPYRQPQAARPDSADRQADRTRRNTNLISYGRKALTDPRPECKRCVVSGVAENRVVVVLVGV